MVGAAILWAISGLTSGQPSNSLEARDIACCVYRMSFMISTSLVNVDLSDACCGGSHFVGCTNSHKQAVNQYTTHRIIKGMSHQRPPILVWSCCGNEQITVGPASGKKKMATAGGMWYCVAAIQMITRMAQNEGSPIQCPNALSWHMDRGCLHQKTSSGRDIESDKMAVYCSCRQLIMYCQGQQNGFLL